LAKKSRYSNPHKLRRLKFQAMLAGVYRDGHIDYASDCTAPVILDVRGRAYTRDTLPKAFVGRDWTKWRSKRPPLKPLGQAKEYILAETAEFLTFGVRCRRCDNCLAYRTRLWAARVRDELANANRTWFLSATLGGSFRALTVADISKEFTRFLGRLRISFRPRKKWSLRKKFAHAVLPQSIKYVMVVELQKDGTPHVHAMIHETGRAIPARQLRQHWRLGYKDVELVKDTPHVAARYITKYIQKSEQSRIRASIGYGK